MAYKFSGKKLEECLSKAEKRFSKSRKDFDYKIIEEVKGFFRKRCVIEVELKQSKEEEEREEQREEQTNNKILITDNEIMLKMDGEAEMEFSKDIKLFVNEEEIIDKNVVKVKASDSIKYECDIESAKRNLNISVSKDRMEAKVEIDYIPERERKVVGRFEGAGRIRLITEFVESDKFAPLFTSAEISEAIKEKGITFGIIESELDKASSSKRGIDLIVARGIAVENDEDDELKINFEKPKRNVEAESSKNVDYKNLYSVANVNEGEVIAEVITGKEGHDGTDVFGNETKRKRKKTLNLTVKDGCRIEENKIIATIEGRPNIKNGIVSVNKVLETKSDVDIKMGNIKFVGDVVVSGSVKDGMKIESGNCVQVEKNVESAQVLAQGQIVVNGSTINSQLIGGANVIDVKEHIEFMKKFESEIEMIITSVKEIRSKHIISDKKADGEIIKLLLESRFRNVETEAKEILKDTSHDSETMDKIKQFLREKIIGSGALGIKYYDQLFELIKCIDNEIEPELNKINCPVDIYLNYCQDTKVKTTGSIFVTGKGQYVSDLSAEENIEFLSNGAVARGGTLSAGKEIKAKVVGSVAGVTTVLKVPKDGTITIDIAYQNSMFIIGDRQYLLNQSSKDVKAYMDSKGEIVVEKFVL